MIKFIHVNYCIIISTHTLKEEKREQEKIKGGRK
jgi:hypothetical protein